MNRNKRILRTLRRKIYGHPIWVDYPKHLQFDTQNYCNLSCEYCNVKVGGSYDLPRGIMNIKIIEYVLRYFGKKLFWSIAFFMNGDGLLEPRLKRLCDMAKRYNNTMVIMDTNGTLYENRKRLIHSNLGLVRFTISAITHETYEKVHGKPLLYKALDTLYWFYINKYPNQKIELNFITTKNNEHEVYDWIRAFKGFNRAIFPIHTSYMQFESERTKTDKRIELYKISDNGIISYPHIEQMKYKPCQCWDILSIGINGELMQCMDFPPKYNYGKIGDIDIIEMWKERNKNMLDNDCCNSCSSRFPNYKDIMRKYI